LGLFSMAYKQLLLFCVQLLSTRGIVQPISPSTPQPLTPHDDASHSPPSLLQNHCKEEREQDFKSTGLPQHLQLASKVDVSPIILNHRVFESCVVLFRLFSVHYSNQICIEQLFEWRSSLFFHAIGFSRQDNTSSPKWYFARRRCADNCTLTAF
jgi:hypothetical protein